MKNFFINFIFLVLVICGCIGLFVQELIVSKKIIFIILILLALFINKKQRIIVIVCTIFFPIIMLYNSIAKIPVWSGRTSNISTDSIWGRNDGFCDTLIYTLISEKKCIMDENCWYYDYISIIAEEVVEDYAGEFVTDQNSFSELQERCQQVGWMHIDANFILINEKAYECFSDGNKAYLYVNPIGLYDSETVIILNDREGNIYIETEAEWKKEKNAD